MADLVSSPHGSFKMGVFNLQDLLYTLGDFLGDVTFPRYPNLVGALEVVRANGWNILVFSHEQKTEKISEDEVRAYLSFEHLDFVEIPSSYSVEQIIETRYPNIGGRISSTSFYVSMVPLQSQKIKRTAPQTIFRLHDFPLKHLNLGLCVIWSPRKNDADVFTLVRRGDFQLIKANKKSFLLATSSGKRKKFKKKFEKALYTISWEDFVGLQPKLQKYQNIPVYHLLIVRKSDVVNPQIVPHLRTLLTRDIKIHLIDEVETVE